MLTRPSGRSPGSRVARPLLHSDAPQPDARFAKRIVDPVLDGIVARSN
ncbi:hypothetical protein ABT009_36125 [Streptomyces sp. NPDC002896]